MSAAADRTPAVSLLARVKALIKPQRGEGRESGPLPVRDFVNISTAQPSRLMGFDQPLCGWWSRCC